MLSSRSAKFFIVMAYRFECLNEAVMNCGQKFYLRHCATSRFHTAEHFPIYLTRCIPKNLHLSQKELSEIDIIIFFYIYIYSWGLYSGLMARTGISKLNISRDLVHKNIYDFLLT